MNQDSDDQVRAIELADWLGVSERAVADYAHRGIITRSSGGLTAQRERIAKGQADKLEMQNAATRRELLPAGEVAEEWSNILRLVRSRMLAAPSRIQKTLGHLSAHDLDIIDREIRDALEELANNGL